MDDLCLRTITRIRAEAPRLKCRDLKKKCDEYIAFFTKQVEEKGMAKRDEHRADDYFDVFQKAFESRYPRVVEVALDGLNDIIENGYLRGEGAVSIQLRESSNAAKITDEKSLFPELVESRTLTLMEHVVEVIALCCEETDDNVHTQLLKILLTVATTQYSETHCRSLLIAARGCFHVHIVTRNQANKALSKANLIQILNVVNVRMESAGLRVPPHQAEAMVRSLNLSQLNELNEENDRVNAQLNGLSDRSRPHRKSKDEDGGEDQEGGDSYDQDFRDDGPAQESVSDNGDMLRTPSRSATTACKEDEPELNRATPTHSEGHESDSDSIGSSGSGGLVSGTGAQPGGDRGDTEPSESSFATVLHKDAYLLFKMLCTWSAQGSYELSANAYPLTDAQVGSCRVLSLELILHLLSRAGPVFRSGSSFLYVIRKVLCVALLENCTSHNSEVTGVSLQIFVTLMANFKDFLKSEIEVFVTTIFLKTLESENSTYDHKMHVLGVLHTICQDPKALVELFINYDCDLDSQDIFLRTLDAFAKIAKNPSLPKSSEFMSNREKRDKEEYRIRMMGLEGMVLILRSLLRSLGVGITATGDSTLGNAYVRGSEDEKTVDDGDNGSAASTYLSPAKSSVSSSQSNTPVVPGLSSSPPVVSPIVDAMKVGVLDVGGGDTANEMLVEPGLKSQPQSNVNVVDVFKDKQRQHEELQNGILKFNLSAKKGLKYLTETKQIEMTPDGVARFLHEHQDKLNKTIIGDYLGREREYENGFCLEVLREYVNQLDFTDTPFDIAIRRFLGGFRLPGEAQKIDRLMESFAERYYLQNRDTFASADMAFIMAFSTIMLQTNLHNPAIKEEKKMTKEQFVKQNKGISADGELSDEMLIDIYNRIAAEPISMNDTDQADRRNKPTEGMVLFHSTAMRRRQSAFDTERSAMLKASKDMITKKKRSSLYVRHSASSSAAGSDDPYIRPMYEITWAPIIGVLSQLLETYDDPDMVVMCLEGFQQSIRLSCQLEFSVSRRAYINALVNFSGLDAIRQIQAKNIESIKVLIALAIGEGNALEDSWTPVLQCVSQLARLQMAGEGLTRDEIFFADPNKKQESETSMLSWLSGSTSKADSDRMVDEANALTIVRDLENINIDDIFLNSSHLSAESVQYFVGSLCEVSLLEISSSRIMNNQQKNTSTTERGDSTPRIFSLQKLVEVADFNMHSRSRLEWQNIWGLLAHHFTNVGMYDNHHLAMYAIDSLRQLSIKFLGKEELSNFSFQRVFLKPFEVIMSTSKDAVIKDLILNCVDVMIRACSKNIRSGWRSIFLILEHAAVQDEDYEIANTGLSIIERLVNQHFELIIYDFSDVTNCLLTFVSSSHTRLSHRALSCLSICAAHLANGSCQPALEQLEANSKNERDRAKSRVARSSMDSVLSVRLPSKSFNSTNSDTEVSWLDVVEESTHAFRIWWSLLVGMANQVSDSRLQVRLRSLETLQNVLCMNGHIFSNTVWDLLFQGVLFPILDSAVHDKIPSVRSAHPTESPPISQSANENSWTCTMASPVLIACIELYHQFRNDEEPTTMLPELFTVVENSICQNHESLARIGMNAFSVLMKSLGPKQLDAKLKCMNDCKEIVSAAGLGLEGAESVHDFGGPGLDDDDKDSAEGSDSTIDTNSDEDTERIHGKLKNGMAFSKSRSRSVSIDTLDVPGSEETSAIAVQHLCSFAMASFTFDFGSLGLLQLSADTPERTRNQFDDYALQNRRFREHKVLVNESDSPKTRTPPVVTQADDFATKEEDYAEMSLSPFGLAEFVVALPASGDVQARMKLKLAWGLLYTTETYDAISDNLDQHDSDSDNDTSDLDDNGDNSSSPETSRSTIAFKSISKSVMTSMVVSASFIRIAGATFMRHLNYLNPEHIVNILQCLECAHWHARSFNEDAKLRGALKNNNFMKFKLTPSRSANLLEQEVRSVTQILHICLTLMRIAHAENPKDAKPEYHALAEPWFAQYAAIVFARYMDLDGTLATVSPVPVDLIGAYKPAVQLALHGLRELGHSDAKSASPSEHFRGHLSWVGHLFGRLILCHDLEVRTQVASLFNVLVLPLALGDSVPSA